MKNITFTMLASFALSIASTSQATPAPLICSDPDNHGYKVELSSDADGYFATVTFNDPVEPIEKVLRSCYVGDNRQAVPGLIGGCNNGSADDYWYVEFHETAGQRGRIHIDVAVGRNQAHLVRVGCIAPRIHPGPSRL